MANSTSIKFVNEHFSLAVTIFEILTFQNLWPWKCKSKSRCTTSQWSIWWQRPDFLSDGNSNVCSIAHHLQDIHKSNQMPKVWPWKWRSRSRRRKTRLMLFDRKCLCPYRWFFFRMFSYLVTYIYAKANTHIHIHKARDSGDVYKQFAQKLYVWTHCFLIGWRIRVIWSYDTMWCLRGIANQQVYF